MSGFSIKKIGSLVVNASVCHTVSLGLIPHMVTVCECSRGILAVNLDLFSNWCESILLLFTIKFEEMQYKSRKLSMTVNYVYTLMVLTSFWFIFRPDFCFEDHIQKGGDMGTKKKILPRKAPSLDEKEVSIWLRVCRKLISIRLKMFTVQYHQTLLKYFCKNENNDLFISLLWISSFSRPLPKCLKDIFQIWSKYERMSCWKLIRSWIRPNAFYFKQYHSMCKTHKVGSLFLGKGYRHQFRGLYIG